MLSFWSRIFQNNEDELDHKRDLLAMEQDFLDQEGCSDSKVTYETNLIGDNDSDETPTSCSSRKGVVTHLTEQNGIIDNSLSFEKQVAAQLFHELSVGCVIEYLAYQQDEDDAIKVIRIQKIVEQSWEKTTEKKVSHRA